MWNVFFCQKCLACILETRLSYVMLTVMHPAAAVTNKCPVHNNYTTLLGPDFSEQFSYQNLACNHSIDAYRHCRAVVSRQNYCENPAAVMINITQVFCFPSCKLIVYNQNHIYRMYRVYRCLE